MLSQVNETWPDQDADSENSVAVASLLKAAITWISPEQEIC